MNKRKILICGASGMAGHVITKYLQQQNKYEIHTAARNNNLGNSTFYLDVNNEFDRIKLMYRIEENKYDFVINCIGILIKSAEKDPTTAILINSYFPHYLEDITKNTNTKIIHLSTDCVFDGTKGNHSETDLPTEINWYGRSKALGEIKNNKDLTLRLSIIGTELKKDGIGLLNWFLNQTGEGNGFVNAYWNGITTLELAIQIDRIIEEKPYLSGIYHLSPDFKINKYDLLCLIKEIWKKEDTTIIPKYDFYQDKTLINYRKEEYNPEIPNYKTQLNELYNFIHNV